MTKPKGRLKAKGKGNQRLKDLPAYREFSEAGQALVKYALQQEPTNIRLLLRPYLAAFRVFKALHAPLRGNQHRALKLQKKHALTTAKAIERKNPGLSVRSLAGRVQKTLKKDWGEDTASFGTLRRWLEEVRK